MIRIIPARLLPVLLLILLVEGCATSRDISVPQSPDISEAQAVGHYKVGNPYRVKGLMYYPAVDYNYNETGIASWYGPDFHLRATANGEHFDMDLPSAAHKTLPLPSIVEVTNLDNGRSLILRVNDRGPFVHGRIIDVSRRAADLLGFQRQGTARMHVRLLRHASIQAARIMPGWKENNQTKSMLTSGGENTAEDKARGFDGSQSCASPEEVEDCRYLRYGASQKSAIFVQLGAFTSLENAHKLHDTLRATYANTSIFHTRHGVSKFHRVRIGPLADLSKADDLLEELIATGYTDARLTLEQGKS